MLRLGSHVRNYNRLLRDYLHSRRSKLWSTNDRLHVFVAGEVQHALAISPGQQRVFVGAPPKEAHNVVGFNTFKHFLAIRVAHRSNLAGRARLPKITQEENVHATEAAGESFFSNDPLDCRIQAYL